jgi:hypothetical protein
MDNNKKSLLEKIAGRESITPFEAIHLQYLNNKQTRSQTPDVETYPNPYIAAENVPEVINPYTLKRILSFKTIYENQQYDAYRWAASELVNLDRGMGDIGYKGLALMNELRYLRSDLVKNIVLDSREVKDIKNTLFEHSGYSQVHQKQMTFSEILSSFGYNMRFFIMSIDDILTLSHYLYGIVETEDLRCLEHLNMWLAEDKSIPEEEADSLSSVARLSFRELFDTIVTQNHPDFVEYMKQKLASFQMELAINFQDSSLEYVKEVVGKIMTENKLEAKELKQV